MFPGISSISEYRHNDGFWGHLIKQIGRRLFVEADNWIEIQTGIQNKVKEVDVGEKLIMQGGNTY